MHRYFSREKKAVSLQIGPTVIRNSSSALLQTRGALLQINTAIINRGNYYNPVHNNITSEYFQLLLVQQCRFVTRSMKMTQGKITNLCQFLFKFWICFLRKKKQVLRERSMEFC